MVNSRARPAHRGCGQRLHGILSPVMRHGRSPRPANANQGIDRTTEALMSDTIESTLHETRHFAPPEDFVRNARLKPEDL